MSFIERVFGDLDDVFAYKTPRTVRIRDRRLGISVVCIQLAIAAYVIGYQLVIQQQYLKETDITASVRLQMQAPSNNYRWPGAFPQGNAPYCTGMNAANLPAGVPYATGSGWYQYLGGSGLNVTQLPCQYLDATGGVPFAETSAIFLTTYTRSTPQTAPSGGACASLTNIECLNWQNGSTAAYYTADVEQFTLLIDHNMQALEAGISRTVRQMSGKMLDFQDKQIDPCDAYAPFADRGGCPSFIAVGQTGKPDIVSVATLLRAAGITNLDQAAGTDASVAGKTYRQAGLVLILDISYDNYYFGSSPSTGTKDLNTGDVQYTYRVSTVNNAEFKYVTAGAAFEDLTMREVLNRHGVRILVSTGGKVGYFNFQTMLVNLTVSLGLLSAAYFIMDTVALMCCPMRNLYRQYKERATIDMSDIYDAGQRDPRAFEAFMTRIREDPFVVDPLPPALRDLIGDSPGHAAAASASGADRSPGSIASPERRTKRISVTVAQAGGIASAAASATGGSLNGGAGTPGRSIPNPLSVASAASLAAVTSGSVGPVTGSAVKEWASTRA